MGDLARNLEQAYNMLKQIIGLAITAFGFTRWASAKLWYLITNVFNFPPFGKWYLWVWLWLLWYTFLTRPKTFEVYTEKIVSTISMVAGKVDMGISLLTAFPIAGPLIKLGLWLFATPVMVMLWIMKQGPAVKYVFLIAIVNLILKWIPWVASYPLVLILLCAWAFWLRSKEERDKTVDIFRKYGPWKGIFVLISKDFLPHMPRTTWTCSFCGYKKNPIDDKGPSNYCENRSCRARNPDVDWKCPQCKHIVNKGNRQFCRQCGAQNPFRDERGRPILVRPEGLPPAPEQPQLPPHAEPEENAIDMVECPRCHVSAPRADFCGECGFRFAPPTPPPSVGSSDSINEYDIPTN